MDVAITGSSGLIGTALIEALNAAGHRPLRVVRGPAGGNAISWDPKAGTVDAAGLEGVEAVVHLAGAGIGDHRWTDAYKKELVDSRTDSTSLLARTVARLQRPPAVLVSASAVGWYGDRGDEILDESSAPGAGFLPELCQQWEAAARPARDAGIRVLHPRSGVVLSTRGGALKKQLPLFKLGLGGRMGSGRQWLSWISLPDEVAALVHLLTADVAGPVNVTAPNPVRNAEFTTWLGTALRRPTVLPIPSVGPKLLLGSELAAVLLYEGQRVMPTALEASGFEFRLPTIDRALGTLVDTGS
jgi:uncharacterized protein (TIGR01777 family)